MLRKSRLSRKGERMSEKKVKVDIRIRELDNGFIVTVEKQDGLVFHKFYCKDFTEILTELNKKLLSKK